MAGVSRAGKAPIEDRTFVFAPSRDRGTVKCVYCGLICINASKETVSAQPQTQAAASRPRRGCLGHPRTAARKSLVQLDDFLTGIASSSPVLWRRQFLGRVWREGEGQMAFEFGMFHEFQRTAGVTDEAAFATSFEEIDAAERWGLDAMWLAEIHVNPERSVCSAPLTLASAIAARTKRMKIGTGVQVLPLCHPLRLAEEAATVDQVSQGRLIFGVGRSGVVSTYDAYQVPYGESRERFAEILDIVKKAWTQPRFSYAGKYHRFDDVACVPHPYRDQLPP